MKWPCPCQNKKTAMFALFNDEQLLEAYGEENFDTMRDIQKFKELEQRLKDE